MKIFIHTYGRADRQVTWSHLPEVIRMKTNFVVQEREAHLYPIDSVIILPSEITQLGPTRQWLMGTFPQEKICILDDDLDFAVRREDDATKFRAPEYECDIEQMFHQMEHSLDSYALVGVAAREGANRNTADYIEVGRQMRIHAINATVYNALGIRFDRVEVMEDFDVTLQFLEAGYPNLVLNHWVTNQAGSNTSGGCSHYRTLEVQSRSAHRLAELHPGFVSVIRKKTKGSWGGQERDDVIVQWKKAYAAGRARLLDSNSRANTDSQRIGRT